MAESELHFIDATDAGSTGETGVGFGIEEAADVEAAAAADAGSVGQRAESAGHNAGDSQQAVGLVEDLADRLTALRQWQQQNEAEVRQWREHAEQQAAQVREWRERAEQNEAESRQWREQAEQHEARAREWDEYAEQLDAQRRQTEQRLAETEQRLTDYEQRDQSLAQRQQQLDERAGELDQQQQALDQREREFDQRQAAQDQQQSELDQRQAELDEAQQAADQRQQDLDHRAAELAGLAEREAALARQEKELAARQRDLDRRHGELEEHYQTLAERQPEMQKREADLVEQRQTIERRQQRLEQDQLKIDRRKEQLKQADAVMKRRRAKIRRYLTALRQRAADLDAAAPGSKQAAAEGALRSAEHELDGSTGSHPAISAATSDGSTAAGDVTDQVDPPHENEPAKPAAAPTPAPLATADPRAALLASVTAHPAAADLHRQRRELAEIRQVLETSEQQMLHKWATYRAGAIVAGAILTLTALLWLSYFAAGAFTPPMQQASMRFVAGGGSGEAAGSLPSAEAARQAIRSKAVLNPALTRMARAGLSRFTDAATLADHLEANLSVSRTNGALLLRYRTATGGAGPTMQPLGEAFLSHQQTQSRIAGREPTMAIAGAMQQQRLPRTGARLATSGWLFGVLALVTGGVAWGVRWLLARTPGVFEEPEPTLQTLDDPNTWSPLHTQALSSDAQDT